MHFLGFQIPTVHAANGPTPIGTIQPGQDATAVLGPVLNNVITVLLFIAGAAALIYLMVAGIQYITSAGNPEAIKKARSSIINAVIGIAVIAATYAIINVALHLGGFISASNS